MVLHQSQCFGSITTASLNTQIIYGSSISSRWRGYEMGRCKTLTHRIGIMSVQDTCTVPAYTGPITADLYREPASPTCAFQGTEL
jgi:hypothetical protein